MTATSAAQRRKQILKQVETGQECMVTDLAAAFCVSEMTIRRDLDALASEGRVLRTHGGAAATAGVVFQFRFLEKAHEHRAAKEQIAVAAARMVKDGSTVILDSGTTTLALARQLRARRDLTVITTALPIASELQYCDTIDVILLGGRLRRDAPDLSGAITLQTLEALHADIAFLGSDAIDLKGSCYNESTEVAHLIAAMSTVADAVYVVADSSKIGHAALGRTGSLKRWDGLITDKGLSPTATRALRRQGVKILFKTAQRRKKR